MIQGTTRTVTISETEYKSLVKGSMKARVAWVHGKFGVASAITVSDVSIICLD
jgi:predicted 3-demethylubiquinone-9 3-methyltransferase (glyoxalase superfamily)